MSNEQIPADDVPVKKIKKSSDKKKDTPKKPRTPAQIASQFQPGNKMGNGRPKTRKNEFRLNCETMLHEAGIKMLINHMYRDDLKTADLIKIVEFLKNTAYGTARQETDEQDITNINQLLTPIIIPEELVKLAQKNDKEFIN